jgi:hypothetical protein
MPEGMSGKKNGVLQLMGLKKRTNGQGRDPLLYFLKIDHF